MILGDDMQDNRLNTRQMMMRMRTQFFALWFLTAILPIAIFVLYITVLIGPSQMSFVLNPQELNSEIWQLDDWNRNELLFRYLNNIVLEDPNRLLEPTELDFIKNIKRVEAMDTIVLLRKGDSYYALNDFETDTGQRVADELNTVSTIKLPEFNSVEYTFNKELFDKTGYSISRQFDFYFPDGEEGTLLFLKKVFNVSTMIGKFLFNYFRIIFITYFLGIGFLTLTISFKFSKNFERVVEVTEAISHEDFDVRLDMQDKSPFKTLSIYINKMAERLAASKDYRMEMEQVRKDFIDNMTHDLKTPLTAIKVQVEALKDGVVTDPEKVNRYLDNIKLKVDNIDAMLNELKIFSELTNGSDLYEYQKVSFYRYVKDITDEWLFEIKEPVEIVFEKDPEREAVVALDVLKMKRVLLNIFENSLKYVKKTPIVLTLGIRALEGWVELTIVDNGGGVPEEKLTHIFNQYYRLDDARNPSVPGSGLGLAICKEIISAHEGDIVAFNHEPNGLGIRILLRRE